MKHFVRRLRQRLGYTNGHAVPRLSSDVGAEIEMIRAREQRGALQRGKRIHSFMHHGLELRLDRDVLGQYRVTVHEGAERRYSFTVDCPSGDYAALRSGYEQILAFLDGDRRLAALPNDALLKGHYYGT